MFRLLYIILYSILQLGCSKIPLETTRSSVAYVSAHWFASENIGYVFYRVSGSDNTRDHGHFTLEVRDSLGQVLQGFPITYLDDSEAVFRHELVDCGYDAVCGSYSLRSDGPLGTAKVTYQYTENNLFPSSLSAAFSNHSSSDEYSFYAYGTFNGDNKRVQQRWFNNFGSPLDEEVQQYGLIRQFRSTNVVAYDLPYDEYLSAFADNAFLFPAEFCSDILSGQAESVASWQDDMFYWTGEELTGSAEASGACLTVGLLDRDEKVAAESMAFARKNPVVDYINTDYKTPLNDVYPIRLVIHPCQDDALSAGGFDQGFFDYQTYITESRSSERLCFYVDDVESFREDVALKLSAMLEEARQLSSGSADYFFVIVFHENLSDEFSVFADNLSQQINLLISEEEDLVSPRLAGAFVYASDTDFRPSLAQTQKMIWCPNKLPENLEDLNSGFNENCITEVFGDVSLGVINFVAPLGPFPSLLDYSEYVDKYDDKGLAKAPRLRFKSVPITASSDENSGNYITFIEEQSVDIADGEFVKVCETGGNISFVSDIWVKSPLDLPGTLPEGIELPEDSIAAVPLATMASRWLSDLAQGSYDIGILWQYPFWGAISYDSTLTASVASIIPFQTTSGANESLAEDKWLQTTWPVGRFLQKCSAFCHHPYFSIEGRYQIGQGIDDIVSIGDEQQNSQVYTLGWRQVGSQCITSNIPEPT